MGDLLGVSVEELIAILKKKHARLPFEIGAFIALESCEALLKGPAKVSVADVRVAEDGSVSIFAPPNSATGAEAAHSVVSILAHVLVAAGPGVPPVLLDLVEQGPSDGRWDLSRLRDELEASLVPLNRQASRRVLSRMLREARREGGPKRPMPEEASPDDLDAELDALIGGASEPPPDPDAVSHTAAAEPAEPAGASEGPADSEPAPSDGIDITFEEAPTMERPSVRAASERPTDRPAPTPLPHRRSDLVDSLSETLDRGMPAADAGWDPPDYDSEPASFATDGPAEPRQTSQRDLPTDLIRRDVDLSGIDESRSGRGRPWLWAFLFLALTGLLVGIVVTFRPDAVDRFLGREAPEDLAAARLEEERRAEQQRLDRQHAERFGDLVVNASPARAQVLLFVGRGPAVADNLPPGLAHEFIAIADGRSPTRALVPPDAEWESTEQGPRYELAMQTGEEPMDFGDLDLGGTRLPRDVGQPGAELGSVRVVTNPPGAKVYQLIGFAPTVRVENVRTDQPQELLVWLDGHRPERLIVGPSDWRDDEGRRTAEISVDLAPR